MMKERICFFLLFHFDKFVVTTCSDPYGLPLLSCGNGSRALGREGEDQGTSHSVVVTVLGS